MHLLHQRGPLHDLPDTPEAYDTVLADVVEQALARMTPEGNLEHPDCVDDIGDTSLGITSLLAFAWQRGKDPRLPEAVGRSLACHLRERVYTDDNPGYPNLRVRNSGLPYARYTLAPGAHPIGDWPSTVWALLQAVNLLDATEGLVEDGQRAELLDTARGYWAWLTEATFFNPQEAGNQAIGCVVGGLMLAAHLPGPEAESVHSRALRLYRDEIRAHRVEDRGAALPPEHGGAYDNNYGPISLSFLAQAHRISGEEMFAEDGDTLARYLDARLTNGGFDNGGPRYSEQHSAFESVLGLRYFGARIGADLGRYRGDSRWARHAAKADGGVDGHFAWMLVWQIQDTTRWHREPSSAIARHQLRAGTVSVAFDSKMTPRSSRRRAPTTCPQPSPDSTASARSSTASCCAAPWVRSGCVTCAPTASRRSWSPSRSSAAITCCATSSPCTSPTARACGPRSRWNGSPARPTCWPVCRTPRTTATGCAGRPRGR